MQHALALDLYNTHNAILHKMIAGESIWVEKSDSTDVINSSYVKFINILQ